VLGPSNDQDIDHISSYEVQPGRARTPRDPYSHSQISKEVLLKIAVVRHGYLLCWLLVGLITCQMSLLVLICTASAGGNCFGKI
jgi:hypothetical protein